MIRTGDIFVDTGEMVLTYIEGTYSLSREDAVKFVIEHYLTKWAKMSYTFFPNSVFNQPVFSSERKRQEAWSLYLYAPMTGATRDKLIMMGSRSNINFYAGLSTPDVAREVAVAHLAAPLACCRFGDKQYPSLMQSNDDAAMMRFVSANVAANLEHEIPLLNEPSLAFWSNYFVANKNPDASFEVYTLSNYAQSPDVQVQLFNQDTTRTYFVDQFRAEHRRVGLGIVGARKMVDGWGNHFGPIFKFLLATE